MDFLADKVKSLNCGKCGENIDPSSLPPLRPMPCPNCGGEVQVPAVFDSFLLTRGLGFGATGYVCLAFDDQLHRQVAIKILKSGKENKEMADECTREARSLAALNHPNIVQIYSIGEFRGQPFIVMELLSGGSADKYIKLNQKVTEQLALDIGIQVAEALKAAQSVGLVHMDVKPDNILFDSNGTAKLIDFGAALGRRKDDNNTLLGTPYYVAPEIVRGKEPSFKADMYSLGATLFHLLSGQPPFPGNETKQVLIQRLKSEAPKLSEVMDEVHPETDEVVARMLSAHRDGRYTDYAELISALKAARVASDQPIEKDFFDAMSDSPTRPSKVRAAGKTSRVSSGKTTRTKQVIGGKKSSSSPMMIVGVIAFVIFAIVAAIIVLNGGDDKNKNNANNNQNNQQNPSNDNNKPDNPNPKPNPIIPQITKMTPQFNKHLALYSQKDEYEQSDTKWYPFDILESISSGGGEFIKDLDKGDLEIGGDPKPNEEYILVGWTDLDKITGLRFGANRDNTLPNRGPGREKPDGLFLVTDFKVEVAPLDSDKFEEVEITAWKAKHESGDNKAEKMFDKDKTTTGWSAPFDFKGDYTYVKMKAKTPIGHEGGSKIRITIKHQGKKSLGSFSIYFTENKDPIKLSSSSLDYKRKKL